MILGTGALARQDGAAVLAAAAKIGASMNIVRQGWNGWNVLHTAAARVGGLDLGFVPRAGGMDARAMLAKGALDLLVLMGVDEIDLSASDAFVVYVGTHGDAGAHRADVVLPGAAYTEKSGLYVNTEGRVQRGERAVFPKGEAREDWAIWRALSAVLGAPLPYDSLDQLRDRLFADHPTFGQIDHAPGTIAASLNLTGLGVAGDIGPEPFASPVTAFHLTNPICRASVTMAECAALAVGASRVAAE
jgi:NADH-quinone oxidoreductase subunit G